MFGLNIFIEFIVIFISIEGLNGCDYRLHNRNTKLRGRSPIYGHRMKLSLERHGVLPDVIDTVPMDQIQIRYPSGAAVNLGNELTPESVKDQPSIEWPVEEGVNYTLIMADPDVPSRSEPTLGQVNHWLVINIPGKDISKGESLALYRGSAPPEGSGLHRYIFLVYKQSGYLRHKETHSVPIQPDNRKERVKFNAKAFAKKYNLGEPIAVNFYQAQSDQYTRHLWAKWNRGEK